MRLETNKEKLIPVVNSTTGIIDKPTIHIVHILDGSGSMSSYMGKSKFDSARDGMLEEINMLKKDKTVNYLYSIIEFDDTTRIKEICYKEKIENIEFSKLPWFTPSGCTALYDAVGFTLSKIKSDSTNKKVLVKIFTDGGENASEKHSSKSVRELIEYCKNMGYVITFIGTGSDVRRIQDNLKIDSSNTLTHDNTSRGVKSAFQTINAATINYSKCVVDGVDSTIGFFDNSSNNTK